MCAETSCGKAYITWQAKKEANKRGVYEPEQITEQVKYYWAKHASSPDATFVNKAEAEKICEESVNYLGSLGSGVTFDKPSFDNIYATTDMLGFEKNPETAVVIMVTNMVAGKTA